MTEIASQRNPRLKAVRRLQSKRERRRSGRFLAEGEDLIVAAASAGYRAIEGYRLAGSGLGGEGFVDVEEAALTAVSTLGSGTRVIGVYEQRWAETPVGPLCVYLHGVGDPGNVGTVLRSAKAFGASSVALGADCADPHSPKAVRASMGAIFDVPIARVESIAALPGERVALVAGAGEPLRGHDLSVGAWSADESPGDDSHAARGLTLLVGAEREGLPDEVIAACERVAHISIEAESLNAAMAATVALYEMTMRSRPPGRDHDTVTTA